MKENSSRIYALLCKLGIASSETELYLKAVELGPMGISQLARIASVPRTTVHRVLEKLFSLGLISYTLQGFEKIVSVKDPSAIETLLLSKEIELRGKLSELTALKGELGLVVEDIRVLANSRISPIRLKHDGRREGIKQIYNEAFEAEELRAYVNLGAVYKYFPDNEIDYISAQQVNRKNRVREIIDSSSRSIAIAKLFAKNTNFDYRVTEMHFVVPDIDILMYENKVAMVNLKNPITGSVIVNPDYFKNSVELFDYVWNTLEKAQGEPDQTV